MFLNSFIFESFPCDREERAGTLKHMDSLQLLGVKVLLVDTLFYVNYKQQVPVPLSRQRF